MERICKNETCQKAFTVMEPTALYCGYKCKRARTMRVNRARKNEVKFATRVGDTKTCEYCHKVIIRNVRASDASWSIQKYHKTCQKRASPLEKVHKYTLPQEET